MWASASGGGEPTVARRQPRSARCALRAASFASSGSGAEARNARVQCSASFYGGVVHDSLNPRPAPQPTVARCRRPPLRSSFRRCSWIRASRSDRRLRRSRLGGCCRNPESAACCVANPGNGAV